MTDKKEIATLSIKISVDSTDLDKLEAQLKRIERLMVSTGLKQPTSVGFSADKFFITNGQVLINEECIEQAKLEKIVLPPEEHTEKALTSPAAILRTSEAISTEQSEFEKFKLQVESEFSQLQAQINGIQCASAVSEQSTAQHLSGLQRQVTELGKEVEEARLKGSLNAINIINIKQTMEQQDKLMIQTIKSVIAEDVARGGPLCRTLR
ncbi:hypothetical protein ABQD47_20645 [Providencia rettgeri]